MNKINSFGAQYKLAKNTWNADNFFKTYDMINNPYYPFVSQSPPSMAEQTVQSNPTLWGSNKIKQCPCGKVITKSQIAEGYATECGECGTNANNYYNTSQIQDKIDNYATQQSTSQELNKELGNPESIDKKRADREELDKKRLYKTSTGQNANENFQSMYSTAMTYGTIPMAPGNNIYKVNQNLDTNYTLSTFAGAEPTITSQGGIDYSSSGTYCQRTAGGTRLPF